MQIPTEPIGSIPRPPELIHAVQEFQAGRRSQESLDELYRQALLDTIRRFEETGSPVITDGEQTKPSFATYPVHGSDSLAPDGAQIPFADGHVRQLPRLVSGPFRYSTQASTYLSAARLLTPKPVKQAVISASALSLLYPQSGIDGYDREAFLADLVDEAEADIRGCLEQGAYNVQIDFTEGRLAVKLDPSRGLLRQFIELNNQVLSRFSPEERRRIGVHTCPGGDQDSTHSADVDYADLLPHLFALDLGSVYLQLASETDRRRVLGIIRDHARPEQRIFIGVIDPIDPRVETHRARTARNHRRLRLLPVRRRPVDGARHRLRQDPRACDRNRAGKPRACLTSNIYQADRMRLRLSSPEAPRFPDDQEGRDQHQPESPFRHQRRCDQIDAGQLPAEVGRRPLALLLHPGEELSEDERIHPPEHEPEEELPVRRRGDVPQARIGLPEKSPPDDLHQQPGRLAPAEIDDDQQADEKQRPQGQTGEIGFDHSASIISLE
jgi:5-methyltetrahydropteroyltriglutamate--homocysteine methyltransferase